MNLKSNHRSLPIPPIEKSIGENFHVNRSSVFIPVGYRFAGYRSGARG